MKNFEYYIGRAVFGGDTAEPILKAYHAKKTAEGNSPKFGFGDNIKSAGKFEAITHGKGMWAYMITDDTKIPPLTSLDREYDYKSITEPKYISFYFRNADIKPIGVLDIRFEHVSGVEIQGIYKGKTYQSGEYSVVKLLATQIGDIELNGILHFIFDNAQTISIALKGERAIVFSYLPNYSYTETKELKTDIFTAQNGKESRVLKNPVAIRYVSFNLTTKEIDNEVEPILAFAKKLYCLVPLWLSAAPIQNRGTINIVEADTKDKEFSAGGYVAIWDGFKDFKVAKVLSLSATSLTLDKAVELKKLVIPLIKATPARNTSFSFSNPMTLKFDVEFKELL